MNDATVHRLFATLLLFAAASTFSATAVAAEGQCTDRPECWPDGSAMRTGLLQQQARERLAGQLATVHAELVSLISTTQAVDGTGTPDNARLVAAVRSQQTAWQRFRESECELIGALSTAASTWQSTRAVECETNLTGQRLKRLRHALRCVRRIAPDDRRFGQQQCLYQLAPLAVPLER